MNRRRWPVIGLCSAVCGGCAGPVDRPWENSTYESVQERYREPDWHLASAPEGVVDWPASGIGSIEELSVDDAVRIAIANSPSLRGAGYRVDVASGRVTQAGAYPNPAFVFEAESLGSDDGTWGETIYKLEQEFVLGGKIRRARGVAEADELAAQVAFVAEEFAVASRVTRAYFSCVAAEERLSGLEEIAEVASRVMAAAATRVDAGAATEPDRLRAEVMNEQAMIELESARLDAAAARQSLASAMGLDGTIEMELSTRADELPHLGDRDEFLARVLEANSRVTLAQVALERARRGHELARAESVPNLVASIGPRYSDPNNETTLDFGLGIEIPLFDRNQGGIKAALADRLSAAAALRSVQLELLAEAAQAWSAYEGALIRATRYRALLMPKAERTLELIETAYERGQADYLRLLDAQQVVVESRVSYVDALRRLHEAAALLRELAQSDAPWREAREAGNVDGEVTP